MLSETKKGNREMLFLFVYCVRLFLRRTTAAAITIMMTTAAAITTYTSAFGFEVGDGAEVGCPLDVETGDGVTADEAELLTLIDVSAIDA